MTLLTEEQPLNIDLVGLTHIDILGAERLRAVFSQYAGKVVTIELDANADHKELREYARQTKDLAHQLMHIPAVQVYSQGARELAHCFIDAQLFEVESSAIGKEFDIEVHYVDKSLYPSKEYQAIEVATMALAFAADVYEQNQNNAAFNRMTAEERRMLFANYIDRAYACRGMGIINGVFHAASALQAGQRLKEHMACELQRISPFDPSEPYNTITMQEREDFQLEKILAIKPAVHIGGLTHTHGEGVSRHSRYLPLCVLLGDHMGSRSTLLEAAQEAVKR